METAPVFRQCRLDKGSCTQAKQGLGVGELHSFPHAIAPRDQGVAGPGLGVLGVGACWLIGIDMV